MGRATGLINKTKKLRDKFFRRISRRDKADLRDEILADSPKAFEYATNFQRRLDEQFGKNTLADKIFLNKELKVDLERVDFGTNDFGIQLTGPAGFIDKLIVSEHDVVEVTDESSVLFGEIMSVKAIISDTQVRLTDKPSLSSPETDKVVSISLSSTTADGT